MKRLALFGALVLLLLTIAVPASAKQDKEWVCHKTNSGENPWVLVHVANGWQNGHGKIGGPATHQTEKYDHTIEAFDDIKAGPAPEGVCADIPPPT